MKKILSTILCIALAMSFLPIHAGYKSCDSFDSQTVAAAAGRSYVIDSNGVLWGWGHNAYQGYLGLQKDVISSASAVKILEQVRSIHTDREHDTYAVKTDGTLWIWGSATSEIRTPKQITDNVSRFITGDSYHFMVIKADGSLWSWGDNLQGQVGNGASGNYVNTPVRVLSDVKDAATGLSHSVALKNDGSLWTWGSAIHLGTGDAKDSATPVKLMDGVKSIICSGVITLVIKNDNSLWGWGAPSSGFGDGTKDRKTEPVKIMDNVLKAAAFGSNMMAIRTDGSLWGWGENIYGVIDGTTGLNPSRLTPVKVMEEVVDVAVSATFAMAIKTDGSLWGWGSNTSGQIGIGSVNSFAAPAVSPRKIMEDVVQVSLSQEHVLAIKTDGSLWGWGSCEYGQVANAPTVENASAQKTQVVVTPYKMHSAVMTPNSSMTPLAQKSIETASAWARDSILKAIELDLVPGEMQDEYTRNITRLEFCQLLIKYVEVTSEKSISAYIRAEGISTDFEKFKDTSDKNVAYAAALGIVNGISDTEFNPNGNITREQAAVMFTRLHEHLGMKVSTSAGLSFRDAGDVSAWAKSSVAYVSSKGIMNGVGNNSFQPKAGFTREQAIVTFYRLIEA